MIKNALICLCLAGIMAGCSGGSSEPPLNAAQEKQSNDLAAITKRANGNWDSLSEADKKAMINIVGSEPGARNMIAAHGSGGPRKGGPPAGG